jgi:hypothetical protein
MKCVRYANGTVKRVSDVFAAIDVKNGTATYVSKQVWKDLARPRPQVHIEGVVRESHMDGEKKVIDKIKLTGVSIEKKHLTSKERHTAEKKKTRRNK